MLTELQVDWQKQNVGQGPTNDQKSLRFLLVSKIQLKGVQSVKFVNIGFVLFSLKQNFMNII